MSLFPDEELEKPGGWDDVSLSEEHFLQQLAQWESEGLLPDPLPPEAINDAEPSTLLESEDGKTFESVPPSIFNSITQDEYDPFEVAPEESAAHVAQYIAKLQTHVESWFTPSVSTPPTHQDPLSVLAALSPETFDALMDNDLIRSTIYKAFNEAGINIVIDRTGMLASRFDTFAPFFFINDRLSPEERKISLLLVVHDCRHAILGEAIPFARESIPSLHTDPQTIKSASEEVIKEIIQECQRGEVPHPYEYRIFPNPLFEKFEARVFSKIPLQAFTPAIASPQDYIDTIVETEADAIWFSECVVLRACDRSPLSLNDELDFGIVCERALVPQESERALLRWIYRHGNIPPLLSNFEASSPEARYLSSLLIRVQSDRIQAAARYEFWNSEQGVRVGQILFSLSPQARDIPEMHQILDAPASSLSMGISEYQNDPAARTSNLQRIIAEQSFLLHDPWFAVRRFALQYALGTESKRVRKPFLNLPEMIQALARPVGLPGVSYASAFTGDINAYGFPEPTLSAHSRDDYSLDKSPIVFELSDSSRIHDLYLSDEHPKADEIVLLSDRYAFVRQHWPALASRGIGRLSTGWITDAFWSLTCESVLPTEFDHKTEYDEAAFRYPTGVSRYLRKYLDSLLELSEGQFGTHLAASSGDAILYHAQQRMRDFYYQFDALESEEYFCAKIGALLDDLDTTTRVEGRIHDDIETLAAHDISCRELLLRDFNEESEISSRPLASIKDPDKEWYFRYVYGGPFSEVSGPKQLISFATLEELQCEHLARFLEEKVSSIIDQYCGLFHPLQGSTEPHPLTALGMDLVELVTSSSGLMHSHSGTRLSASQYLNILIDVTVDGMVQAIFAPPEHDRSPHQNTLNFVTHGAVTKEYLTQMILSKNADTILADSMPPILTKLCDERLASHGTILERLRAYATDTARYMEAYPDAIAIDNRIVAPISALFPNANHNHHEDVIQRAKIATSELFPISNLLHNSIRPLIQGLHVIREYFSDILDSAAPGSESNIQQYYLKGLITVIDAHLQNWMVEIDSATRELRALVDPVRVDNQPVDIVHRLSRLVALQTLSVLDSLDLLKVTLLESHDDLIRTFLQKKGIKEDSLNLRHIDPFGTFRFVVESIIEQKTGVGSLVGLDPYSYQLCRCKSLSASSPSERFLHRLEYTEHRESDFADMHSLVLGKIDDDDMLEE